MIDRLDATSDPLHLAVARAFRLYVTSDLIQLLSERDAVVRTSAARELHIRGGPDVFAAAQKLACEYRYENREIAAFLLGQLGTPHCQFADASFPILTGLFRDNYFEVRAAAVGACSFLSSLGHKVPSSTMNAIVDLWQSSEPEVRVAVAAVLGFYDDIHYQKVLDQLLDDDDREVREMAEFSLELRESRKTT
jgi:HEAT repeat protein